jgi:UrcA family protein
MKNSTRFLALGALLTTTLALTVPATAAGRDVRDRSEVVKYNDLNLSTTSGAQQLYTRLKVASSRVCRDVVTSSGLPALIDRAQCAAELLDTAVKDVNKPVLTALHQGRPVDLTASR